MQGKGISTHHIHRTRWEPFSSCVLMCVYCNFVLEEEERGLFIIILSLARFRNSVPTYSLVQWESQNSVVPLKKV